MKSVFGSTKLLSFTHLATIEHLLVAHVDLDAGNLQSRADPHLPCADTSRSWTANKGVSRCTTSRG